MIRTAEIPGLVYIAFISVTDTPSTRLALELNPKSVPWKLPVLLATPLVPGYTRYVCASLARCTFRFVKLNAVVVVGRPVKARLPPRGYPEAVSEPLPAVCVPCGRTAVTDLVVFQDMPVIRGAVDWPVVSFALHDFVCTWNVTVSAFPASAALNGGEYWISPPKCVQTRDPNVYDGAGAAVARSVPAKAAGAATSETATSDAAATDQTRACDALADFLKCM